MNELNKETEITGLNEEVLSILTSTIDYKALIAHIQTVLETSYIGYTVKGNDSYLNFNRHSKVLDTQNINAEPSNNNDKNEKDKKASKTVKETKTSKTLKTGEFVSKIVWVKFLKLLTDNSEESSSLGSLGSLESSESSESKAINPEKLSEKCLKSIIPNFDEVYRKVHKYLFMSKLNKSESVFLETLLGGENQSELSKDIYHRIYIALSFIITKHFVKDKILQSLESTIKEN